MEEEKQEEAMSHFKRHNFILLTFYVTELNSMATRKELLSGKLAQQKSGGSTTMRKKHKNVKDR